MPSAARRSARSQATLGAGDYRVRVRYVAASDVTREQLASVVAKLSGVRRLARPSAELAVPPQVVDLAANIRAKGPIEAADAALKAFSEAVEAARLGADPAPTQITVEPASPDELERSEVVSGAEVARRLGISRERVRQLAEERGRFPNSIGNIRGSRAWRWGDVADWVASGGRRPRGRPKTRL